jgi:hypothetical protein
LLLIARSYPTLHHEPRKLLPLAGMYITERLLAATAQVAALMAWACTRIQKSMKQCAAVATIKG